MTANEMIVSEPNNSATTVIERSHQIIVTQQDVAALTKTQELINQYVKANLVEGMQNDYAIIPGCVQKCLLKPGAQKLRKLFGLGVKIILIDKIIDQANNFVMFTYRAEVFNLRNDVVIASCEGACNSQEKKYRERPIWEKKGDRREIVGYESANAMDSLNTIMKMAQKRAIVGATIEATGVSDFFTQDKEEEIIDGMPMSDGAAPANVPMCCGKKMMVSKFNPKELYCITCKKKVGI